LLALDERGVTFRTRGESTVTVAPQEFLRRFLLHVLPKGFVKIRHYGLFAPSHVSTKLAAARRLLGEGSPVPPIEKAPSAPRDVCELMLALTGIDLRRCKRCGGGPLLRYPLAPLVADPPRQPRPPDTS
jgi:putative transposase